jgi:hypothetical protein
MSISARRLLSRPKAGEPVWPRSAAGWCAHISMLLFYLGTIVVGALAAVQPSRTLEDSFTTPWLVYVWSGVFVVCGVLCLVARYLQEWKLEALCLFPQAGALLLWGVAVLTGSDSAVQIGTRLVVGGLPLIALACFVFDWTAGQKKLREQLAAEQALRKAADAFERVLDERERS